MRLEAGPEQTTRRFRVGITANLRPIAVQAGLAALEDDPLVKCVWFTPARSEVAPEEIRDFDGVVAGAGWYTRATLRAAERLMVVGRFGVGYDNVDVEACTEADIMLFITPEGVRRPVASTIMGFVLALSLRLLERDRFSREGRTAQLRAAVGTGLTGRTLGSIGFGNIARDLFRLAAPFDLVPLAHDPFVPDEHIAAAAVRPVDLDTLLRESDFVSVNTPLTAQTRGLVGKREIALMKRGAYLINTARGPIVDTAALVEALRAQQLAGAGLDATDPEPLPVGHPLLKMDNVIVTSHSAAWTDEILRGNGQEVVEGLRAAARGFVPRHVVNHAVLERPGFQGKLATRRS